MASTQTYSVHTGKPVARIVEICDYEYGHHCACSKCHTTQSEFNAYMIALKKKYGGNWDGLELWQAKMVWDKLPC